jgi:hypothetical protein
MVNYNDVISDDLLATWKLGFEQGHDTVGKVAPFVVYWIAFLESAKVQFLGVDTSRQHESPHVWHGTTCSLIRIPSGSVPCSMVRSRVHGVLMNRMVQEGPLWGNRSNTRGASQGKSQQGGAYYLE